jgi:hypothetical protein
MTGGSRNTRGSFRGRGRVPASRHAAARGAGAFYTTKPVSFGMGLSLSKLASAGLGQPGAGTSETELGSGAVAGPSTSPRPFHR